MAFCTALLPRASEEMRSTTGIFAAEQRTERGKRQPGGALSLQHALCVRVSARLPAGVKTAAFRGAGNEKSVSVARAGLPLPLTPRCAANRARQPQRPGLSTHQFAGFGGVQGICKDKQKQNRELRPRARLRPGPHSQRLRSPARRRTVYARETETWANQGAAVRGGRVRRNRGSRVGPAGTAWQSQTLRRARQRSVRLCCFSRAQLLHLGEPRVPPGALSPSERTAA